jgi:hypothetical protein
LLEISVYTTTSRRTAPNAKSIAFNEFPAHECFPANARPARFFIAGREIVSDIFVDRKTQRARRIHP